MMGDEKNGMGRKMREEQKKMREEEKRGEYGREEKRG